jgi:hypothetical protein
MKERIAEQSTSHFFFRTVGVLLISIVREIYIADARRRFTLAPLLEPF